jgi:AcrR family transcriptional regulator
LETATELFADKGFRGTTTREIAELARVNEAIIFRHFQSKEELYWAVIEHQCQDRRVHKAMREYAAKDLPVEEVFKGVALEFLRAKDSKSILNRLLLFSALEHHVLSERFFRTHMAEFYEETAKYIRRQIEAGKLRDVDPLLAARGFWGMLVYHFWLQDLFGAQQYQPFDVEHVSSTLVDVWLGGMLPREQKK